MPFPLLGAATLLGTFHLVAALLQFLPSSAPSLISSFCVSVSLRGLLRQTPVTGFKSAKAPFPDKDTV